MIYENFKHIDPDDFHDKEITLHDCIADKIVFEQDVLYFYLPDGLWIAPHHQENPSGNLVRTDAAAVSFSVKDIDEITARIFTGYTWFGAQKARVEYWSMKQLMAAVNSGRCTIEFIEQYRNHYEQMWHCAIHSHKKPWYRDCQLYLPETEATFFWNNIRPERVW